jgi:hypothetical protein
VISGVFWFNSSSVVWKIESLGEGNIKILGLAGAASRSCAEATVADKKNSATRVRYALRPSRDL